MSDVAFGEPDRDLMGPLAPSAPTPARPSRAYERDDNIYPGRARDFEFVDTSTMGKTPSAIRGRERDEQNARTEYQTSRTEYLDMDTAAVDDARAAAHAGLMIAAKPGFSALSSYAWGRLGDGRCGFR